MIDYLKDTRISDYNCSVCRVQGYKLWREANRGDDLVCAKCLGVEVDEFGLRVGAGHRRTDQVAGRVPAVPTPDGNAYWGYTSVPDEAVKWWKGLK